MAARDRIYRGGRTEVGTFEFNEAVADVFDDMISRSIPLYNELQTLVARLALNRMTKGGAAVDIGCSTGRTLHELDLLGGHGSFRLLGIDPSPPMIAKAQSRLAQAKSTVEFKVSSWQGFETLSNVEVAIALFVVQFIRPPSRPDAIRKAFDLLKDGGRFLMAEKIVHPDKDLGREYIELHHAYKLSSGYSKNEVAKKREALENVLVPYTREENLDLLRSAGFTLIDTPLRWLNFELYLAEKR